MTRTRKSNILVVDDEHDNLLIIRNYLMGEGYTSEAAMNGEEAWEKLSENPDAYDLILLDWMMPKMNGLDVLKAMQKHPQLRHLQVIMQTARARADEIKQGIDAGAWYYLTKPFEEDTLLAIVKTALADRQNHMDVRNAIRSSDVSTLHESRFAIRTLKEAQNLAPMLSKLCHNPEVRGLGFLEILLNAIEHGNLGITYQEKTNLMSEGMWKEEVESRLALPENEGKVVEVIVERHEDKMTFLVKDQGSGFDWNQYLEFDPQRAMHSHGRGIAMANSISFDDLKYRGCGNEVLITVNL